MYYVYLYICIERERYVCIYIYIYIRKVIIFRLISDFCTRKHEIGTVSSYNFKPRTLEVRGSNPRIVAYVDLEMPISSS